MAIPIPTRKNMGMLTNLELIRKWVPEINDFKPTVGFKNEQHQKVCGDRDGIIYHKVIDLVPLKRFSFTFQSDQYFDNYLWL